MKSILTKNKKNIIVKNIRCYGSTVLPLVARLSAKPINSMDAGVLRYAIDMDKIKPDKVFTDGFYSNVKNLSNAGEVLVYKNKITSHSESSINIAEALSKATPLSIALVKDACVSRDMLKTLLKQLEAISEHEKIIYEKTQDEFRCNYIALLDRISDHAETVKRTDQISFAATTSLSIVSLAVIYTYVVSPHLPNSIDTNLSTTSVNTTTNNSLIDPTTLSIKMRGSNPVMGDFTCEIEKASIVLKLVNSVVKAIASFI